MRTIMIISTVVLVALFACVWTHSVGEEVQRAQQQRIEAINRIINQ